MPEGTESATPPAAAGPVFQFLRENFAVISGLAIVGGVGLSTIFLSSYLSFFDWHLLWFVQYTDILTFGLIAVGIIGGSFMLLQNLAQTLIAALRIEGAAKRRYLIGFGLFALAFVAFGVWSSIRRGEGYHHVLFGAVTIALGIALIFLMINLVKAGKWPNPIQAISTMFFIVICTVFLGQWLAYSVSETSEFDQDVKLKNGTINDAKLIIVMSRFTILLKDRVLHVVPTTDVTEFQTKHALLMILPSGK
jgi:hypothetical protein